MMSRIATACLTLGLAAAMSSPGAAKAAEAPENLFQPKDAFELEFASDPRISPNGKRVVYVRNSMDIMTDRVNRNLWIVDGDGSDHRPLATGAERYTSPRWSPDGKRLAYIGVAKGSAQLYLRWMDTGQTAKLTNLQTSPGNLAWSPDGTQLAFTMRVADVPEPLAKMPAKPKDAQWAEPVKVIDRLIYRADGQGFLEQGFSHLFVVPADGGTPRQLTKGPFNHNGTPSWTADGQAILISTNRNEDWEYDPVNSEVYSVSLSDGLVTALTDRKGPDAEPRVSPDGALIAYTGFDDRQLGYQVAGLYLMDVDGSNKRLITKGFDRNVQNIEWAADAKSVLFRYESEGNSKLARVSLDGVVENLADNLGGTSIGRPYQGGTFTVAKKTGAVATIVTRPGRPADVLRISPKGKARQLTHLNEDLLGHKVLAEVEEIWFESSFDKQRLQGWIAKPPGFDSKKKYPLILEIHGGPFADYGARFSAEIEWYAAAGYVVLYMNPRGSTSYGQAFGNLIHHAYPGNDYDDLMSGVDAVIARGYIDDNNLFVTGGSGGGVLTAWIVGKTKRFQAAVVAKPVINWTSFVLTSDAYNFFYKYWFPGFPWDHPEEYRKRSPLTYVGNVTTPTMLLTGESDNRTPISETEQFYQALKLLKVDTAMVRVPGAPHGITRRPSNLIAKVVHILAWFDRYRTDKQAAAGE